MPDLEAPKQSPVDIAPQPAYKSNKLHSDLSAAPTLDPDLLEIVEVLLSIHTGSVSIVQTKVNVKKIGKVPFTNLKNHHKPSTKFIPLEMFENVK
jgi:hypothetical protein